MSSTLYPGAGVTAPVMDDRRLERQKEVLLAYVQDRSLLLPDTNFRYLGHEYVARGHEPMLVALYLRIGDGDVTFDFTLEELQLFQGRRFPTPTTPATPASSAPTTAPPQPVAVAKQIDWANNRESLFANVATLEPEARRFVSMQLVDGRRTMTCRCVAGLQDHLCDHLQFVYATSWERDKLLDESGSGVLRQIRLPIGMGEVYLDLEATIFEDDRRPLGRRSTGYVRIGGISNLADQLLPKLAAAISPYPSEADHVILAPGEGTIKAIRYIESLLRGTESYQKLSELTSSSGDAYQQANLICRRNHTGDSGRRLVGQFIAGLRPGNAHRESWMVACAYAIFMFGLCLPCHKATSSAANVPAF